MIVRIVVTSDIWADVFSPFVAKDLIKAMPSSQWSTARKCWRIDLAYVNMAADALRQAGYTVYVTDADGKPYGSSGSHGTRNTPATDWIEQAFQAAPRDRAEKLRRGLMAVFHPDHGGDTEVAKRINVAADNAISGGRRG